MAFFTSIDDSVKNQRLSRDYLVKDLMITDHMDVQDTPSAGELSNLKTLAVKLEKLEDRVGAFDVISGYRSDALQARLRGFKIGAAVGRSFHQEGAAVDIVPRIMTVRGFWEKTVRNGFYKELGEFYLKPSHNSIHLSLPYPHKTAVVGIMNDNSVYQKLTTSELARLDPSHKTTQAPVLARLTPMMGVAIAGTLLSFYFLRRRR